MDPDRVSGYLAYLPEVLKEGPFIGRFLLAFEAILSGLPELAPQPIKGLEQNLNEIHRFFIPKASAESSLETDENFLPWLAQWVAASLYEDWDEATRRKFIQRIVPLYRKRGTRVGIEAVLRLSGEDAQVVDFGDDLHREIELEQFGPGDKPPHFFGVLVKINTRNPQELARRVRRVREIVDREKPAHTYYGLRILYPALMINNDPANNRIFGPGIVLDKDNPPIIGTVRQISIATDNGSTSES